MSTPEERLPTGESFEDAIPIHAGSSAEGVSMEYELLAERFGRPGVDFQMMSQALIHHEDRSYDVIHIRLADGTDKEIHFDITEFFGKDFPFDLDEPLGGRQEDT